MKWCWMDGNTVTGFAINECDPGNMTEMEDSDPRFQEYITNPPPESGVGVGELADAILKVDAGTKLTGPERDTLQARADKRRGSS